MADGRAIQHCMDLLRTHNYGRYLSLLYLPPVARDAAFSIFAFDAEVSRIASLVSDPLPGEIRLQWWRDVVGAKGNGDGNPVAEALVATIKHHALPVVIFQRLLDAHEFDLYHDPMPDKASFEGYLGETYCALFHLMTMIILDRDEQRKHESAISNACGHGGVFSGSVELLKQSGEHHHGRRQYFPDELSQHSKLFSGTGNKNQIDAKWLEDIVVFSNGHLERAAASVNKLPEHCIALFLPITSAGLELEGIVAKGVDLSVRYQPPSRLKTWWRLQRAARTGNIC